MRLKIAPAIPEEVKAKFPEIHPVVLQLLHNRGLETQEDIDVFLGPDWSRDVHSPHLFANMGAAVGRVFQAIDGAEVITVHGDYDADGVCGSAVLVSTLREIIGKLGSGASVNAYIPHREKEGYGMSVETAEHLAEHEKTNLVITVDCGISNKPAVDRAKELGIDTIICDHHSMPDELPDQAVLIHPQVPGEPYPNKVLCGTGVGFKLASALISEARDRGADLPEGHEKWLLDLVAIATVTDVMPLTDENRVLEKYGLLVLNKTRRVGLKKLIDVAGIGERELDTYAIGFQIGPRLNAAGRMDHANEALELMIEEDPSRAADMAMALDETNKRRQTVSNAMYEQAKEMIGDPGDAPVIVVWHADWPPGIVGLVAGKLVRDFHRPVYVAGANDGAFTGSGRSVEGFDVTQALHSASELLSKFGGHPEACGFSVERAEAMPALKEALTAYAQEHLTGEQRIPTIRVDAEIALEDVTWELFDELEKFKPCGHANPKPAFAARGVLVKGFRTVGKADAHLKLTVQSPSGGAFANAIAFRQGEQATKLALGDTIDVVFEIDANEWNGNRELQLKVDHIKIAESRE